MCYLACVFRNAAQRRFVASMIAFRPAALRLRFLPAGAVGEAAPACFLVSAHLFRWATAILARAVPGILRRFIGPCVTPSDPPGPSRFRSSPIRASSRFFCSSKPATAASTISVLSLVGVEWFSCFAEVIIVLREDRPGGVVTRHRQLFQEAPGNGVRSAGTPQHLSVSGNRLKQPNKQGATRLSRKDHSSAPSVIATSHSSALNWINGHDLSW